MRKTVFSLFAIGVAAVTLSCATDNGGFGARGKKESVEVGRKARYFSQIDISAPCNVHFTQGDRPSIRIAGDRQDVENVITVHKGEELSIRSKSLRGKLQLGGMDDAPDVYITSPDLIKVSLRGVGDFEVEGKLDTDTLEVALKGAGDIRLPDVICDRIAVSLNGAGDIELGNVRCNLASLWLRGAGNVEAVLTKVAHTDIKLLGTGEMDVSFNDCRSADCELTGIGEIELKGRVKTLRQTRRGTGNIDTDELVTGRTTSEQE